MTILFLLTGCLGLETNPERKDGNGRDLDSADTGLPLDSGDPLDSAEDGNEAPVADAGLDDDASVGIVVSLDGAGSFDPDEDPLLYTWRLITQPGSSVATLLDDDRPDPQFIPDAAGRYVVGLIVSDGALQSEEDTVEITATMNNGAPVANAGPDQSVPVGGSVNLNGSSSSDPESDPLQFAWTLVRRPSGSVATLSSTTSATPRFTVDVAGTYEISLTVSDGTETSDPDTVYVNGTEDSDTGGGSSGCGCTSTPAYRGYGLLALGLISLFARRRPSA
ncbi:MAG: PKD domain-containing protein [Pseudomonadota bacterium]|nr:PKD domain-containing protein [Pseudomonadota bacterium]